MIHSKYLKTQLKTEHLSLLPESCGGKVKLDRVTKYIIMHIHKGANGKTKIIILIFADFTVCSFSVTNKCFALCFGLVSLAFVLGVHCSLNFNAFSNLQNLNTEFMCNK